MKVTFVTKKDGKERVIKEKLANFLAKAGKGSIKTGVYQTRDMVAGAASPEPKVDAEAEEKDIYIELLKDRGINKDRRTSLGKLKELLEESDKESE